MKTYPSYPDREFKVWDYLVSHSQMVIRSPGSKEGSPNVDLHLRDVRYLRIGTVFHGLTVVEPTDQERDEAQKAAALSGGESMVWVLESRDCRHLIVAGELGIAETDFPMMSTALIHPSSTSSEGGVHGTVDDV